MERGRRDSKLIDALEAIAPTPFEGRVWRIVKDGRSPLQCSASGGRWDDGSFDVLYTSMSREGAIEEMRFHLMRGQPVMPSKIAHRLFELEIALEHTAILGDLDALAMLGLDIGAFGRVSYNEKSSEYPRTQEIGETAQFLDFDGLIVPSARSKGQNLIIFCDKTRNLIGSKTHDHGPVKW